MKSKNIFFVLIGFFAFNSAYCQTYAEGEKYRVGLKAGPIASTLVGTALATPSIKYGFTGGLYFKYQLRNGFHFQTEICPTIRGALFKNNGRDGYNKINLLYMDAVELILKDLSKENHTHCVAFGLQPSILVQSWVYNPIYQLSPAARGIALNGGDLFLVFGYQLNKKIIGIQSLIKIGSPILIAD